MIRLKPPGEHLLGFVAVDQSTSQIEPDACFAHLIRLEIEAVALCLNVTDSADPSLSFLDAEA